MWIVDCVEGSGEAGGEAGAESRGELGKGVCGEKEN